jgi:hypothetical protein
MAYLRKPQENKLYSEGQSGVTGGEQTAGGQGAAGAGQTKAATGQGWYNIQDFLNQNQSQLPKMQSNLQGMGSDIIGQEKQKEQGMEAGIQKIARPEANQYSDEGAMKGDEATVRSGLSQTYAAPDYSQFDLPKNEQITSLQPGSTKSLTQFARSAMPQQGANYSSGMQKTDQLLYGADPNFVNSFAKGLQDQYQGEVIDPLTNAVTTAQAQDATTKANLDTARQGWGSGLSALVGKQNQQVKDTLAKQQADWNAASSMTPYEAAKAQGGYIGPIEQNKYTGSFDDFLRANSGNYATLQGFAPDQNTAATQALGSNLGQYNMLAGLLGQYGGPAMSQYAGQQYTAPGWNVNKQKLADDFSRVGWGNEFKDVSGQVSQTQKDLDLQQIEQDRLNDQIRNLNNPEADNFQSQLNFDKVYPQMQKSQAKLADYKETLKKQKARQSELQKLLSGAK